MRLIVIGRNPQEANIVINSQYISNYHAEIILLDNGDMFLVDKSTNGTFLNGIKLTPGKEVAVKRGDNVMFADMPLDWGLIDEVRIPKDVKQIKGIGSHYMNAINVQGPNVSRFHATIRQMADGKWYISDHSKNGTTVNGARIQKNRYVRINKGDEIACAGVPIQNPIPGSPIPWKWIGGVLAVACVIAALFVIIDGLGPEPMPPTEISNSYSPTVSWMRTYYHFEVSCKGVDLSKLKGVPTEFIINSKGKLEPTYMGGTMYAEGTGFFLGDEGNIVTNRHVARPWETEPGDKYINASTFIEMAEAIFREELLNSDYIGLVLPHISTLEVKGVVDQTILIPSGSYYDPANVVNCHEIACSSIEEDLAIFQIRNNMMLPSIKSIPYEKIHTADLALSSNVYTIGYPLGLQLQDYKRKPLQPYFAQGSVSNMDSHSEEQFSLTAVAQHGASGSPIFDDFGRLVGILNAGIDSAPGFTYAIKAKYLHNLLVTANIIKVE